MQTEIEAKFLDIDPEELRKKLKDLGAELIHPERLMRRRVFHLSENPFGGRWLRVRDEGDRITLTLKEMQDRTLHGTREVTIEVDDFEKACALLSAVGMVNRSYQETKRERWEWNGVEVTIDTWPWIPPFVELEGSSEGNLRNVAEQLGLDWNQTLHGSVETAYQRYYDVTDQEIDSWQTITFVPIPDWLEVKRRK